MPVVDTAGSWLEGRCCELGAFGYSRDKERGGKQIEYGLLTDDAGRPIAIKVFSGNTSDTKAFVEAVELVVDTFGLSELIMVGDRWMITNARIGELLLNATLVTPDADIRVLRAGIVGLVEAIGGARRLMIRSDGGLEKHQYYRGGNSFLIDQVEARAKEPLDAGRAVILLEATNRFTNRLTV